MHVSGYKPKHMANNTYRHVLVALAVISYLFGALVIAAHPAHAQVANPAGWYPLQVCTSVAYPAQTVPGTATTYIANGRTRVNLPQDIVADLNNWAANYTYKLQTWQDTDPDYASYYAAQEEGFNYAFCTIMARLGYLDPIYRDSCPDYVPSSTVYPDWVAPDATLQTTVGNFAQTNNGIVFYKWENGSFGYFNGFVPPNN